MSKSLARLLIKSKIKVGSEWMSTELGSLCYQPPNKEVIKMQLCCLGEISPSSIFFSWVMTNMIRLSKSCKSCCFFFPAADLKLPATKMGCKKQQLAILGAPVDNLAPLPFEWILNKGCFLRSCICHSCFGLWSWKDICIHETNQKAQNGLLAATKLCGITF